MTRILIADDDPNVLEALGTALRREGYEVVTARDGGEAWDLFALERPDLALLDVAMPRLDGMALARRIAASGDPQVPVILLSGRGQERSRVMGLDSGADDYIVKPYGIRELHARIRAALRRVSDQTRIMLASGMIIDPATHRFTVEGREIEVTATEFTVLLTLIERAGRVVPYNTLMQRVWGSTVSHDLLRVTVYRLRRKIEPNPHKPRYIRTVPGVGFLVLSIYSMGSDLDARNEIEADVGAEKA